MLKLEFKNVVCNVIYEICILIIFVVGVFVDVKVLVCWCSLWGLNNVYKFLIV